MLRDRPRLGGVGEEHLAGIGRPMGTAQRQDLDVGAPTGHEFVASGGQLPVEVREAPILGVATGFGAQQGDCVLGDLLPCHRQSACVVDRS